MRLQPTLALVLLGLTVAACAHTEGAGTGKKRRHAKAHDAQEPKAQDANAPDKPQGEEGEEAPEAHAVSEPKALGPDTWQVEADGRTLEEAAQAAAHVAVLWCAERKKVPLPESDASRRTKRGVRMIFTFHCVQVQQDPPPMPMMDLDPMPLDRD